MKKKDIDAFSALLALEIGKSIVTDMVRRNPEVGKPYKGIFKKYMLEYKKQFLDSDLKQCKRNIKDKEELQEIQADLDLEYLHIECFCRWLDNEKHVKLDSKRENDEIQSS